MQASSCRSAAHSVLQLGVSPVPAVTLTSKNNGPAEEFHSLPISSLLAWGLTCTSGVVAKSGMAHLTPAFTSGCYNLAPLSLPTVPALSEGSLSLASAAISGLMCELMGVVSQPGWPVPRSDSHTCQWVLQTSPAQSSPRPDPHVC